ncbi:MAG: hypothetical protein O3A00_20205 [Planctomycetota bacterium]|nr:hypothetical protein [Planctomycetota bacterium]
MNRTIRGDLTSTCDNLERSIWADRPDTGDQRNGPVKVFTADGDSIWSPADNFTVLGNVVTAIESKSPAPQVAALEAVYIDALANESIELTGTVIRDAEPLTVEQSETAQLPREKSATVDDAFFEAHAESVVDANSEERASQGEEVVLDDVFAAMARSHNLIHAC